MKNDLTEQDQNRLAEIKQNIEELLQEHCTILTGEVLSGWVMVHERTSFDLETIGKRGFGILAKENQSFITSRGLLENAIDVERANFIQSAFNQQ